MWQGGEICETGETSETGEKAVCKQQKKRNKKRKKRSTLTGLIVSPVSPTLSLSLQEWNFEAGRLLHNVMRTGDALGVAHE